MYIIIGSAATGHHGITPSHPKDVDVLVKEGEKIMAKRLNEKEKQALLTDIEKTADQVLGEGWNLWGQKIHSLLAFDNVDDKLTDYRHIEQDGGGEGSAEDCSTVFSWKGVLYKMFYSYHPHDGFDFDCVEFYTVTPVQKTVTVYE